MRTVAMTGIEAAAPGASGVGEQRLRRISLDAARQALA
jgi:hypothetical protein